MDFQKFLQWISSCFSRFLCNLEWKSPQDAEFLLGEKSLESCDISVILWLSLFFRSQNLFMFLPLGHPYGGRKTHKLAKPPAIYRSASRGVPESAPASAFGVLLRDSQKVPRRVLPRVPRTLGVLQECLSLGKNDEKHSREQLPIFWALGSTLRGTLWESPKGTPKALAGALSGIPLEAYMAGGIANINTIPRKGGDIPGNSFKCVSFFGGFSLPMCII